MKTYKLEVLHEGGLTEAHFDKENFREALYAVEKEFFNEKGDYDSTRKMTGSRGTMCHIHIPAQRIMSWKLTGPDE